MPRHVLNSPPSPQAARQVRENSPLRQARTCYDHLAGVAGVQLMDQLLTLGWLEPTEYQKDRQLFRPTLLGQEELTQRGLDLTTLRKTNRRFAYGCVDWTERGNHLAGSLAAAILQSLQATGTITRHPNTRTVTLAKPLVNWLGR